MGRRQKLDAEEFDWVSNVRKYLRGKKRPGQGKAPKRRMNKRERSSARHSLLA